MLSAQSGFWGERRPRSRASQWSRSKIFSCSGKIKTGGNQAVVGPPGHAARSTADCILGQPELLSLSRIQRRTPLFPSRTNADLLCNYF